MTLHHIADIALVAVAVAAFAASLFYSQRKPRYATAAMIVILTCLVVTTALNHLWR